MFGRSQNSTRFLFTILFGFTAGCREDISPDTYGNAADSSAEPCSSSMPGEKPDVQQLHADAGMSMHVEGQPLTPMDLALEESCATFSSPVHFSIDNAHPGVFVLQPITGLQYCVYVMRESGYITLQHEEGRVMRDSDSFSWCVERERPDASAANNLPAKLEVLSLTRESTFSLRLRRGME